MRVALLVLLVGCAEVESPDDPCGVEPTIPVYGVEHDLTNDTIILARTDYLKLRDYVVWARCVQLAAQ